MGRDAVRMSPGPAIRIDELLVALRRILDEVVIKHGGEVQLLGDYYWSVPIDAAFDVNTAPDGLTIGQLSDDIESVRHFLAQPVDQPITIWHELAHAAGVLRGLEQLDRRGV